MTPKQEAALRLALEFIKQVDYPPYDDKPVIAAIEEALAEQPAQQECNHCGGTGDVSGEYPGVACPECNGSGVQAQPEFIKHEVENTYDWSEWVCPDPESYLMKCCDCGLVHEAQFRVAKYQPSPSDECEVVSDPDLQAQFRMRRSEQWSPEDTAHRAGGLPMAELPAQQKEPVVWMYINRSTHETAFQKQMRSFVDHSQWKEVPLYSEPLANHEFQCVCGAVWCGDEMVHLPDKRPQPSKPLTDKQIIEMYNEPRSDAEMLEFARAIEAAHGIKGDA